jgi:hypothetical protein
LPEGRSCLIRFRHRWRDGKNRLLKDRVSNEASLVPTLRLVVTGIFYELVSRGGK